MSGLATGASAFSTFFQVLPRLFTLFGRMRPTWHVPDLAAIDVAFIQRHDVRGMIWDVDGTLTGDRETAVQPAADGPFRALMAMPGLKHVVLSNAGEERFAQLGSMFPLLPLLRGYRLGSAVLFRRRQGNSDTWSPEDLARQLGAGARVIRKPSATLVDYAVRELGCDKADVVMIGDQYLTDVAGANLGGVRSIKLPTLAPETFRTSVKLSQRIEKAIYAVLYGRADMARA